jgi:multiple sugar transport system substrate-binding protein
MSKALVKFIVGLAGLTLVPIFSGAIDAKTITLKMLVVGTGKRMEEQLAVFKEFETQHPGIKVQPLVVGGGMVYYDKYIAMTASGTVPDVMMVGTDICGRLIDTFRPLNALIASDKVDMKAYHSSVTKPYTKSGQLYALPVSKDLVTLAYNMDMFKSSGVTPPTKNWEDPSWTWDEFGKMAKKMTVDRNGDGKPDQFGFADLSTGWWQTQIPYIWGTDWIDDGKAVLDISKAAKGFDFWLSLQTKLGAVGGGNMKAAMWSQASWGTTEALQSIKKKFQWDVCAVPAAVNRGTLGYADAIAIPRGVKHLKESWLLAKHIALSDSNRRWAMSWGCQPASSKFDDWYTAQGKDTGLSHKVFVDGSKYVHVPGYFAAKKFSRIDETINNGMSRFWSGKVSAEQALNSIMPAIKQILATK